MENYYLIAMELAQLLFNQQHVQYQVLHLLRAQFHLLGDQASK